MEIINSVQDFLEAMSKIEGNSNIFFRGHSSEDYDLLPGIYRKNADENSLIQFEDKIYRDIITKAPSDFAGKNTLESLTLLQHYGGPTRILDLTENALVALYFACSDNGKNGEVIVFDVPDNSVCHYESDKVTVLANITKCDSNFYYYTGDRLKEKWNSITKKIKSNLLPFGKMTISQSINLTDNEKTIIENFYREKITKNLNMKEFEKLIIEFYIYLSNSFKPKDLPEEFFKNSYFEQLLNHINVDRQKIIPNCNFAFFGKLIHNIREDKSYFMPIIDPGDVCSVFAVRPKQDNARLIRQQGAFFIFGVEDKLFLGFDESKPIAKIDESWIIRGKKSVEGKRIIINEKSKNDILLQLDTLGINISTLFPEIDKITEWVKYKYHKLI